MSEASAVDTTTASGSGLTMSSERHLLDEVLVVARRHLRMEVAFIASVSDGRRTFEYADMAEEFRPFAVGDSDPLDDTYCGRVLTGLVPELMLDARNEPSVADLAVTTALPVGTHLSVPVCTKAGVYGTLCCFSRSVVTEVSASDLDLLRMLADIVGKHLEPLVDRAREEADERELLSDLLDAGGPTMVVQPIVELTSGEVWCYEALARFPVRDGWAPPEWFDAAHRVGLGTALESAAVHNALALLPRLPEYACLSVNVSVCALLGSASIAAMLTGDVARRLVVEVTEHERIADLQPVHAVLARARAAGVKVAVDDAGSGFAGMEHILNLAPEVLKLDRALVDGIATDPARQAMCEAMVGFCRRTGAVLVAEGLETTPDLEMLRQIGVTHAQGYLLGRPAPLRERAHNLPQHRTAAQSFRTALPATPHAGSIAVLVLGRSVGEAGTSVAPAVLVLLSRLVDRAVDLGASGLELSGTVGDRVRVTVADTGATLERLAAPGVAPDVAELLDAQALVWSAEASPEGRGSRLSFEVLSVR